MVHKPEEIIKRLRENEYAPIYFLFGAEVFYIDQITLYIEENALEPAEKGFNQMIFYGKDVTVNDLISHAKRFPMMSERQVVIIKEAQGIQDFNRQEAQEMLANYVQNPLPSTILVLAFKNKTLDKRKSLFKTIEKHAIAVESKKLYDNQIPDWVFQYISDKGHEIEVTAAQILIDFIGNDLERLSNEINKVLINYSEKVTITPGIVQKYIGISKDYNAFELQRAIAVKDILKANKIVNYFGTNTKTNPIIPVIALIFNFFSKILVIHKSKDKSQNQLAKLAGVNPYFIKEYIHAAQNYSLGKVIQNIHYIREADLRSKGVGAGNIKDGEILKELVYKLLH
jgi:DNA polymerase-3 subunit delta